MSRQDECPRILLSCYRARNSRPEITSPALELALKCCFQIKSITGGLNRPDVSTVLNQRILFQVTPHRQRSRNHRCCIPPILILSQHPERRYLPPPQRFVSIGQNDLHFLLEPCYRHRVTLVIEYLGWVDLDLGSSPGWWAGTVATYSLGRQVEEKVL